MGKFGNSAVMTAAQEGATDVAKLLASAGADLERKDKAQGWTALASAVYVVCITRWRVPKEDGGNLAIRAKLHLQNYNQCVECNTASLN